ncbi:hypothetical protein BC936DRAFT_137651 [Jimgerdemannia flammicorona]|uniref:Uncharacterized protein n=1 Tax=Jimgerdemannia flammicorona TaxID=994334 RepID=A0A433DJ21_9FUNG|nr:hypothetical protein BC936DRAFT_137651 [Jimgerdemannia flammicorona]
MFCHRRLQFLEPSPQSDEGRKHSSSQFKKPHHNSKSLITIQKPSGLVDFQFIRTEKIGVHGLLQHEVECLNLNRRSSAQLVIALLNT